MTSENAPGTRRRPSRRPRTFARPVWYPVAGAVAVLALLAGGGMTLLTISHGPRARPVGAGCGLVTCGASLPRAVTSPSVPATAPPGTTPAPRRHRPRQQAVLAPTVHSQSATPSPAVSTPPPRHPCHGHHGRSCQDANSQGSS